MCSKIRDLKLIILISVLVVATFLSFPLPVIFASEINPTNRGFETGDFTGWTQVSITSNDEVTTDLAYDGNYSWWHINPTGLGSHSLKLSIDEDTNNTFTYYININSSSFDTQQPILLGGLKMDSISYEYGFIGLGLGKNATNDIVFYGFYRDGISTSDVVFEELSVGYVEDTWYKIEFELYSHTSDGTADIYVDDINVMSKTGLITYGGSFIYPNQLWIGDNGGDNGPPDSFYLDIYYDGVEPSSVLSLPFDNETSSTTTYDQSGEGNNGSITGATRIYAGYYGMALSFDGDDYVTVVDDDTLDLTDTITLSAWVKTTDISVDQVIFDKPNVYGLYLFEGGVVGMMINSDYYNSSASAVSEDIWHHVVGEYDGSSINIYLDEVLIHTESCSGSISVSAFDLIIGDTFDGTIDECIILTIYDSELLGPIVDYPYVYQGVVDTTACSWILSTLTYNFTSVYVQQNSTYAISYALFNFTDGETELGLSYTVSSETFGEMGNEEDVEKLSFITHTATTSNNALTLYARIRIEETILSYADVDLFMYCEATGGENDSLTNTDDFSIYGIGGVTTTTVVGDGALIAGGSVFDVMAQNSTETGSGSSIRVDTVAPNFQHVHILTHLYQGALWDTDHWDCPTDDTESGYLEYGVDYMEENCTWVTGWKVRIEVVDGKAGTFGVDNDESWVRLNCTWYNNGSIVKSDDVYAFYEAYQYDADFNDTTTQFSLYIDLWISSDEFSSNVAGHVSSQYYGMREAGWWLWANWGPVGTLQTSSTFYDDLYNEDNNITSASTLKIFRVWSKIAKVSTGAGSCDDHLWASENEVVQIKQIPFNVDLVGISSPVFMPTTTPDAPMGFFASIGNILSQALDSIYNAIIGVAQAGVALTASVIDEAFGVIGISDFSTTITSFMGTLAGYFATSVGYVTSLIVNIFVLFATIFTFIVEWFGRVVSMFISIAEYFVGILDGTYAATEGVTSAMTYLTEFLAEDGALSFVTLIMLISWFSSMDDRAKRMGGGWMSIFIGDINAMISVFSFMLDLAWRVVNAIIDLGMRFINMFVPL